jgi:coiled-coil domain-containing protein 130
MCIKHAGVRFNAEKKCIGQYYSTKIWQFAMRHHCGCIITIQTDPKRTEYICVEGAKKKVCTCVCMSV